jgi:hypothetical protein
LSYSERICDEKMKEERLTKDMAEIAEKSGGMRSRIEEIDREIAGERRNIEELNLSSRVGQMSVENGRHQRVTGGMQGIAGGMPSIIEMMRPGGGGIPGLAGENATLGRMMPLIMGASRIEVGFLVLKNRTC